MEIWGVVANVGTAVATIILALVAVFQDPIRHFVRSKFPFDFQPDLGLRLIENPRWEMKRIKGINCGAWTYYGEVRNANSKVAATRVQVILLNLQEIPDDESESETVLANVPIQWHLQRIKSLEATIGNCSPLCGSVTQA